jgi:hypothetical protein
MDRKELIEALIAKNKSAVITPEIREAQLINFAVGNSFDVYPKEKRLTEEFVKSTIYGAR